MYNERPNPENPTLSEFSKAMHKQVNVSLSNSYNELPLNEDENPDYKPFNLYEADNKNDDEIYNFTEREPYYNTQKLTVHENLDNLLGNKRRQKSILVNNNIKESIRNWNQMNKIKRNLIQDTNLNWINDSIENPKLKLKKLEPSLLQNEYKCFDNILDLPLKTIYSNDICRKEIKGDITKDHNKKVIQMMENNHEFNIKINLYFRDTLQLFFNEPMENKIFDDNLKEGFIDYKKYFDPNFHKHTYSKKFSANLKKLYEKIAKNKKQIENTTDPSSEHL